MIELGILTKVATAKQGNQTPAMFQNVAEQVLNVDSVANPTNMHAHLALLRWFRSLENPDKTLDTVYLIKAEQRYMIWLNYLNQIMPSQENMIVPPIDVGYIWHSHMLSPFRYYEDLLRLYPEREHMLNYVFPLDKLHNVISNGLHVDELSQSEWSKHSHGQPYVLTLDDVSTKPFIFTCPWCFQTSPILWETWAEVRTTKRASFQCTHCTAKCSADTLSGRRFLNDVCEYCISEKPLIAGTIVTPATGFPEIDKAHSELKLLFTKRKVTWDVTLAKGDKWELCEWKEIESALMIVVQSLKIARKYKGVRFSTVPRARSSYMGLVTPFSIDLLAAVVRQRDFTEKMISINLDTQETLTSATRRYYGFLMLMRHRKPLKEKGPFVPTLDIDLGWHTHMLFAPKYREYCTSMLDRVLNHDDTIVKSKLEVSLVQTAWWWYQLYKEPYTSQNVVRNYLTFPRILFAVVFPLYGPYVLWKALGLQKVTQKVQKTTQKVQNTTQKVQKATQKIQKATEKVQKAKQKAQKATQKVQKPGAYYTTYSGATYSYNIGSACAGGGCASVGGFGGCGGNGGGGGGGGCGGGGCGGGGCGGGGCGGGGSGCGGSGCGGSGCGGGGCGGCGGD